VESIRTSGVAPPAPELCAHVAQCDLCKGALLALLIEASGISPESLEVDCQNSLDDLAPFIELETQDTLLAIRSYPHVWWHIWTCEECAANYRLIRALSEAERAGQLTLPPIPRRITLPNVLHLSRQFLNQVLPPIIPLRTAMRGAAGQPLVIAEEDDSYGYAISLRVQPQSDGAWRVMVIAVPPPVGSMVLTLGASTFQTPFDAKGYAVVSDVPPSLLVQHDGPDLVVGIALDE
jgi:hypothetical protein